MLLILAGFYVLICVGVYALQRRLIYFPTKLNAKLAEARASESGVLPWKNQSGKIVGWKLAATGSASKSVLVIHGNAGCALDRTYFADPIHDATDADVYLLEYPGYGVRKGSPDQQSFLKAADEAISLLPNNIPLYVVSESLGTGVAAHLAKMHPTRINGLALFVPYNNLVSVAQNAMPFLPVKWILKDRFDPAVWLKDYRGPVKFILAERDEVIPSRFGKLLYDGYSGRKELQIISQAGHNDVSHQSVEWWKETFNFWEKGSAVSAE